MFWKKECFFEVIHEFLTKKGAILCLIFLVWFSHSSREIRWILFWDSFLDFARFPLDQINAIHCRHCRLFKEWAYSTVQQLVPAATMRIAWMRIYPRIRWHWTMDRWSNFAGGFRPFGFSEFTTFLAMASSSTPCHLMSMKHKFIDNIYAFTREDRDNLQIMMNEIRRLVDATVSIDYNHDIFVGRKTQELKE